MNANTVDTASSLAKTAAPFVGHTMELYQFTVLQNPKKQLLSRRNLRRSKNPAGEAEIIRHSPNPLRIFIKQKTSQLARFLFTL